MKLFALIVIDVFALCPHCVPIDFAGDPAVDVVVSEPAPTTSTSSSSSSRNAAPEATLAPLEPSLDLGELGITVRRAKEFLAPYQKQIQDNIAEGNVGERGEEWAVAQVKTFARVRHTHTHNILQLARAYPLTTRVGHLDLAVISEVRIVPLQQMTRPYVQTLNVSHLVKTCYIVVVIAKIASVLYRPDSLQSILATFRPRLA